MGRAVVLQEIRVMRFEEIQDRFRRGRLSALEASEWLGCSERTAGLLDRRIGRVSPHRIAVDEVERIVRLYRDRYAGWTVKHFHERGGEARSAAQLRLDQERLAGPRLGACGTEALGAPQEAAAAAASGAKACSARSTPIAAHTSF